MIRRAPILANSVLSVPFSLASTQIKTLHSSPFHLISDPPAGHVISLIKWVIRYSFLTVPYGPSNFVQNLLFTYRGTLIGTTAMGIVSDFSTITLMTGPSIGDAASSDVDGVGIDLTAPGDFTDGDGSIAGALYYEILTA